MAATQILFKTGPDETLYSQVKTLLTLSATALKIKLTVLIQATEALQDQGLPTPCLISLHFPDRVYTLVTAHSESSMNLGELFMLLSL